MSSKLGMEFGEQYGEAYGKVVSKWGKKLKGVSKITEPMKKEWAKDLRGALEKDIIEELTAKASKDWKSIGPISDEAIKNFAKQAVRRSMDEDHFDLLERLRLMAQEPEPEDQQLTASMIINNPSSLTAAISVSEALKRVGQTAAQIFDMAKDSFNAVVGRFFQRRGDLTGKKRWRTVGGAESRHRSLDGQVKNVDESFNYKGESISGPRPPGGSPENWSNCSCYLEVQKKNGDWVRTP